MKGSKGITLIALVITIIVMLILVGVSVTVALNGGLFTRAKTAASGTEEERQKELALSNGDIIDEWVAASGNESNTMIHFTINGEPYTALAGETWREFIERTNLSFLNANGNVVLTSTGSQALYEVIGNDKRWSRS